MPNLRYIYHLPDSTPNANERLRSAGREWLREARRDVPVDTGRLKRSLYYEVTRLTTRWKLQVGTRGRRTAAYAQVQEDRRSYAKTNFDQVTSKLDNLQRSPQQRRIRRQTRRFDTVESVLARRFNR